MTSTPADRAAQTPPASPQAARGLPRFLRAIPLSPGSQVLALGRSAGPLAASLRGLGHRVGERERLDAADHPPRGAGPPPARFDAVVAVGFLEREPWDRWELQRIHGRLREGGTLVLVVPNLFSPLLLLDPRYVLAKLAKQWSKLMGRATAGPSLRSLRERGRSYGAGRLRAMLEALGFEVTRLEPVGPPVLDALPGGSAWFPTHHVAVATGRPSLFGVDPGRGFPDAAAHSRRFEDAHRDLLRIRADWLGGQRRTDAGPLALRPADHAGASVLVLSPHPDDELVGCGGTLLELVAAGARVTVLQATDGSASAALRGEPDAVRRTVRLAEAAAVAEAAGFAATVFWREDNAAFAFTLELVQRLRATLESLRPTLILTPFITDIHPDHLVMNRILAAALAEPLRPPPLILGYEVWSVAPPDLVCDVTASMPRVERLLLMYETAMKVDDFVHGCAERNYHHAWTLSAQRGFAEAFFTASPAEWVGLVHEAVGAR